MSARFPYRQARQEIKDGHSLKPQLSLRFFRYFSENPREVFVAPAYKRQKVRKEQDVDGEDYSIYCQNGDAEALARLIGAYKDGLILFVKKVRCDLPDRA